jgi:hypothetical protein
MLPASEKNMTTETFWNSLEFAYWTSYSFNRGAELAVVQRQLKSHQEKLQSAGLKERILLQKQTSILEEAANVYQARLLNKSGQLNPTAKAIRTVSASASENTLLAGILTAAYPEGPQSGCGPIYRDAIAFYNQAQKLVNVLHICFQCLQLEGLNRERLSTETGVFGPLHELLTQLGHEIETEY